MALSPWVRPIAYCENDRYAQAVLLSRMSDGQISAAPIWDDVSTLLPEVLPREGIDIIYGGFPCQDISIAGTGKGLEGERSGLFFEITRLAREIRPAFLFLENVPAIRTRGLGAVIESMAELGYDCRWEMLSAQEIGAPHKRERWFCLAHRPGGNDFASGGKAMADAGGSRLPIGGECRRVPQTASGRTPAGFERGSCASDVDDTVRGRHRLSKEQISTGRDRTINADWWESEPDVGRVVNGLPFRVDRIRGLGNAVVPAQAREAFKRLCGLK